jgi:hypothetical protein
MHFLLSSLYSVPLLLVIDEYNCFLAPGKLVDPETNELRQDVDPSQNAVAALFDWITFRLVRSTSASVMLSIRR